MAEVAGRRSFRALVGVDLRRMRGHVMRGILITAAFMGLSIVAGHGDMEDVAVVLAGTSFYFFLWPAVAAAMDRHEGGMEFLASVPVSPRLVAWARATGIAIALLPCALYLTVAFAIALGPALGIVPTLGATAVVFAMSWLFTTGLSTLSSGVFMRWGVDILNRGPALLAILGLGVLVLLADRNVEAIRRALATLFIRTGWAWGLTGTLAVVSVLSLGLGHWLMTTGLARFRPERGRLKA